MKSTASSATIFHRYRMFGRSFADYSSILLFDHGRKWCKIVTCMWEIESRETIRRYSSTRQFFFLCIFFILLYYAAVTRLWIFVHSQWIQKLKYMKYRIALQYSVKCKRFSQVGILQIQLLYFWNTHDRIQIFQNFNFTLNFSCESFACRKSRHGLKFAVNHDRNANEKWKTERKDLRIHVYFLYFRETRRTVHEDFVALWVISFTQSRSLVAHNNRSVKRNGRIRR